MKFIPLSLKEYYLWKRHTAIRYPWHRYINMEFMDYEKKRLQQLDKWYHHSFRRSKPNTNLDEISYYVVPVELPVSWRGSITALGDFNYVGLAGLQNSPHFMLLGLIPRDVKSPRDYRLVNIIKSRKTILHNQRNNRVKEALLIDKWDYLPSDSLYTDIPVEKMAVQKMISENLIHDRHTSMCLQAPIVSTPYVQGSVGGISLSSITGRSSFAFELMKTLEMMMPPEYRSVHPPEKVFEGVKHTDTDGFKYQLAERPFTDNRYFSCSLGTSYSDVEDELSNRRNFKGEYSVFSTLNHEAGNYTQMWKELLKHFASTEITISEDLDDLPYIDVDLTRVQKNITEDLWLQVVNNRQLKPSMDSKASLAHVKTVQQIERDFDAILADVNRNDAEREFIIRYMLYDTRQNLQRLAQCLARTDNRDAVNDSDLRKARSLIVDNLTGFIQSPRVQNIKSVLERKKDRLRYSHVQTHIIYNPGSSAREIYDAVSSKAEFADTYDLQRFLGWLEIKGYVIVDQHKCYHWTGKH